MIKQLYYTSALRALHALQGFEGGLKFEEDDEKTVSDLWRRKNQRGTRKKKFQHKRTGEVVDVYKEIDHHNRIYFSSVKKPQMPDHLRFTFAHGSWLYKNFKPINL